MTATDERRVVAWTHREEEVCDVFIAPHINNTVEPVQSSTHWGKKKSAGLAGSWIIEVSWHGKSKGWCQRILAGLGECWLIEVPD